MLRTCALAVTVLVAGAAAPAQAQDVNLRWKFKEGEKFYVEDVTAMKLNVTAAGATFKEDQKTTLVTRYTVKKLTSDAVVLTQFIESVEVRGEAGGLGGTYAKIMERMKGAEFTVTLTGDGKISKFEGFDEFAKKLVGDDEDLKLAKELLKEDVFRQSVEQAFGFMPQKAVKKGDSWKTEAKMPFQGLGEFKTTTTYTYEGKGEGGEQIAMGQTLTFTVPKGSQLLGGVIKIKGGNLKAENAKGTLVFDAARGRLASAKTTMTVKGSLTVDVAGTETVMDLAVEQSGVSRVLDQPPGKE